VLTSAVNYVYYCFLTYYSLATGFPSNSRSRESAYLKTRKGFRIAEENGLCCNFSPKEPDRRPFPLTGRVLVIAKAFHVQNCKGWNMHNFGIILRFLYHWFKPTPVV